MVKLGCQMKLWSDLVEGYGDQVEWSGWMEGKNAQWVRWKVCGRRWTVPGPGHGEPDDTLHVGVCSHG